MSKQRAALIAIAVAAMCAAAIAFSPPSHGDIRTVLHNCIVGRCRDPNNAIMQDRPDLQPPLPAAGATAATAVSAGPRAPIESTPAAEIEKPVPALHEAFEREPRDATSGHAEQRIRDIFSSQPGGDQIFRNVRCTRSVCRAELRWSPELSPAYNKGLGQTMLAFTRDISLDPDLGQDGPQMPVPMAFYVARPGHSTQSILADQKALARQER